MNQLAQHEQANSSATTGALLLNTNNLEQMYRAAEMMSSARVTMPKHLAGSPGDCLAIMMQAMQWGMNPFAVAQKTHLVNGTLGYEAQLVNAVVSSSSLLASRIDYEFEGDWKDVKGKTDKSDSLAVTVSATLRGEQQPRCLRVSMAQAGVRNSPNWESDPRQQLAYLATKKWARLHAPDVLLGVYTPDELATVPERHMGNVEEVVQPPAPSQRLTQPASRADKARAAVAQRAAPQPTPAPQAPSVTLPQVLQVIDSSTCLQSLREAGATAKHLLDEQDKAIARDAYEDRLKELKAASAAPAPSDTTIDASTGEVVQPASGRTGRLTAEEMQGYGE